MQFSRGSMRSRRSDMPSSSHSKTKHFNTQLSNPNDIFHHSFYQQRMPDTQNFQSEVYIKKYLAQSGLSRVLEGAMSKVLSLQKLPLNPFNMMYRMIHHESIYQNLSRYYKQLSVVDVIGSNDMQMQSSDDHSDQQFVQLGLRQKTVYCSSSLERYANASALYLIHSTLLSPATEAKHQQYVTKYELNSISVSFGGPLCLLLRGNGGDMGVSVKGISIEKSWYCCESMLQSTVYIHSRKTQGKTMQQYVQLVIQDVRSAYQESGQGWALHFQKIEVLNMDDSFNLIQYSRQQIIGNAAMVQKQLLRAIQKQNLIVRLRGVYRLWGQLGQSLGQQFITYTREYILIEDDQGQPVVLSNQPLKHLMQQFHCNQNTIQNILGPYKGDKIGEQYITEALVSLGYCLKTQNVLQFSWEMFYCLLYDPQLPSIKLLKSVSYLLLSPVWHVFRLLHKLKAARWVTLPSFPQAHQHQLYNAVMQLQKQVIIFVRKGDYVYWQLQIFYDTVRQLLTTIVQVKDLKVNTYSFRYFIQKQGKNESNKLRSILFLLDNAILLLQGTIMNLSQMLLVLQGHILNYCGLLHARNKVQQAYKCIGYDVFLRNKQAPTKVLDLQLQAKTIRRKLQYSQSQVRSLLTRKYISHYNLYPKIYSFYWQLFIGRKVMFPLSSLLQFLMVNSTQASYQLYRDSFASSKHSPQLNVINKVPIYELADQQHTVLACYSLSPSALHPYALNQYKITVDMALPLLQQETANDLGYRYGSQNNKETRNASGKSNPQSKRNSVILGIIGVQLGQGSGQEVQSFHQFGLLLDVLLGGVFGGRQQLYSYICDYLYELMQRLQRGGLSVVGLFPNRQNQANLVQEQIYSKMLGEQLAIRYDYKRKFSVQRLTKLIQYCLGQQMVAQIRIIYKVRDIVKTLRIVVNFHHRAYSTTSSVPLFPPSYIHQRLFLSKKELMMWCQLHASYNVLSKLENTSNIQKLQNLQQVSLIDLLAPTQRTIQAQQSNSQSAQSTANQLRLSSYYKQSPFFNILQRCLQLADNLRVLVQYLKSDRRGRYDLSHIRKLHSLLKYYLMEKCTLRDGFIYSEGVSVCMANLLGEIEEYLEAHPDNNGDERELLYLQWTINKLRNNVRFMEISCSLCIHQSLKQMS